MIRLSDVAERYATAKGSLPLQYNTLLTMACELIGANNGVISFCLALQNGLAQTLCSFTFLDLVLLHLGVYPGPDLGGTIWSVLGQSATMLEMSGLYNID